MREFREEVGQLEDLINDLFFLAASLTKSSYYPTFSFSLVPSFSLSLYIYVCLSPNQRKKSLPP